jgi:hypothetical protein
LPTRGSVHGIRLSHRLPSRPPAARTHSLAQPRSTPGRRRPRGRTSTTITLGSAYLQLLCHRSTRTIKALRRRRAEASPWSSLGRSCPQCPPTAVADREVSDHGAVRGYYAERQARAWIRDAGRRFDLSGSLCLCRSTAVHARAAVDRQTRATVTAAAASRSGASPHCSPTQDGVPRSEANSAPDCVPAPAGEPWAVC